MTLRSRPVAGLLLVALLSAIWSPAAAASDANPPSTPPSSWNLPLSQIGLGASVDLAGITASQVVTLPVPQGLKPSFIEGQATLSLDASTATVEVDSGGVRLGVVHLDNTTSTAPVSFVVPLRATAVASGLTAITLRTQVAFDGAYCQGQYRVPTVTLDGLTAGFTGSATKPTTVADFFPPLLSHLRMWLPAAPSAAQVQASLDVAAGLVARNPSSPLSIAVSPLASNGTADVPVFRPDTRDVVFANSATPVGVVVASSGDPLLMLGGTSSQLRAAEQVVAGSLSGLVQSSSSAITGALDPAVIPGTEQTVGQLGAGSLTASGVGQVSLAVPFSQSAFGGMINRLQLHLHGTYTPVANAGETLVVMVNDQTVATSRLGGSGTFDLQPTVPLGAVARDNAVTLTLAAATTGGVCTSGSSPIELRLDSSSSLQSRLGTSLASGFQRLPQALMPTLNVALGTWDPGQVAAAVNAVTVLAHLSPLPLAPRLVSLADGARLAQPLLTIATVAQVPGSLRAPLDLDTGAGVVTLNSPVGQIQAGTLQAAAQVFTQTPAGGRARTVLLIEARSELSLAQLSEGIGGPLDGLGTYTDDAAVLTAKGNIQQVSVGASVDAPTIRAVTSSSSVPVWGWAAVGAAIAVLVVFGAGALRRRHETALP